MDSYDLFLLTGHQAQRIGFAKILLFGKRELYEILRRLQMAYAGLSQALSIEIVRRKKALYLVIHLRQLFLIDLHTGLSPS